MENEPRSAVQHTYMCSGVTSACAFFLALTCAAAPLTRSSIKYPTSLPIMVQANTQDTYDEKRTVEHIVFYKILSTEDMNRSNSPMMSIAS